MYRNHRLPVINSSTKSVEEMSTVILQTLNPKRLRTERPPARRLS